MSRTISLFEDQRTTQADSIALTIQSLRAYSEGHKHWAIAYSGGKDSSCVVTLILHLIETGQIERPESLTVMYADTRQELPPLHNAAVQMLAEVERRGFKSEMVVAPMDKRFWVYILGRGVPSPNNGTFRWCTRQIKGDPMTDRLSSFANSLPDGERLLMLTGVRLGESAARDNRIAISCSKDGGECGQGYFQNNTAPNTDTLAPIIHWRVCQVWDWLMEADLLYGFPVGQTAEAYGMNQSDGEEHLSMRTGCIGCPLVTTQDTALANLVRSPKWAYLSPLLQIRGIHDELRHFSNRLRKDGSEKKKSGGLVKNPGRVGALKLESRERILERVLRLQAEINQSARSLGMPEVWIINAEEEARIRELIALKTFPDKWTGEEQSGDALLPEYFQDGSVQNLLFDPKELGL